MPAKPLPIRADWLILAAMSADRIASALSRIEAAAARIEAAAARPASGDAQLELRYEALRREAGEAMQQIDRLIEGLEA